MQDVVCQLVGIEMVQHYVMKAKKKKWVEGTEDMECNMERQFYHINYFDLNELIENNWNNSIA